MSADASQKGFLSRAWEDTKILHPFDSAIRIYHDARDALQGGPAPQGNGTQTATGSAPQSAFHRAVHFMRHPVDNTVAAIDGEIGDLETAATNKFNNSAIGKTAHEVVDDVRHPEALAKRLAKKAEDKVSDTLGAGGLLGSMGNGMLELFDLVLGLFKGLSVMVFGSNKFADMMGNMQTHVEAMEQKDRPAPTQTPAPAPANS